MKAAIVILNWNGEKMLRQFLPFVIAHSSIEGVEIIVADNASTDESCNIVEKQFPSVRLIRLDRNYGFAEGYNRALAQVEASYYVLLNSDVQVSESWLMPLLQYMDAHPEIAACQPKIRSFHHPEQFEYAGACGGYIDRYGYPFCRGRIFETIETDTGQYENIVPVFWATGAALFIRASVYHEVGGLDGRFFAHMEEIDLCWRLRSKGYGVVCIPEAVVYHVGGGTLKKENPRKTFLNFRNNLLMLYKNLPSAELAHVMMVRCILDYIAMFIFILQFNWQNAMAIIQARQEFHTIKENFKEDRNRWQQKHEIPERKRFSILWQSKILRKRRFSQLKS